MCIESHNEYKVYCIFRYVINVVYIFYNVITCIYDRSKEFLLSNTNDNGIDYVLSVVNSAQHNNG